MTSIQTSIEKDFGYIDGNPGRASAKAEERGGIYPGGDDGWIEGRPIAWIPIAGESYGG